MMDEFNGIFDYFIGELIDNALRALQAVKKVYAQKKLHKGINLKKLFLS